MQDPGKTEDCDENPKTDLEYTTPFDGRLLSQRGPVSAKNGRHIRRNRSHLSQVGKRFVRWLFKAVECGVSPRRPWKAIVRQTVDVLQKSLFLSFLRHLVVEFEIAGNSS